MRGMKLPTYLRVVATTRCNLRCGYCHMEGDPHLAGTASELPTARLIASLHAAALAGVKKFKFLGGEPLLRRDLPAVIAALRAVAPDADISLITAGAVPVPRLAEAYEAGLSRANVSIHGWTRLCLAASLRMAGGYELRQALLAFAIDEARRRGVPIKLNYVWTGERDREDLATFLDWAARQPVLVNVLDDLTQDLSWEVIAEVLTSLRGPHREEHRVDDPHSLPTLLRVWDDGLRVELKHQRLGGVAPYAACTGCEKRAQCKEGIVALRLTHRGALLPCMDRDDLGFALAEYAAANGPALGAVLARNVMGAW